MKKVRYAAEAALIFILLHIFRLMPLDAASAAGGFIARTIGPRLAASRKARRNLARALPDLSPAAHEDIVRAMWDNLGRTVAELPHLDKIAAGRTEIIGADIAETLRDDGRGAIIFGGHFANWELALPVLADRLNLKTAAIYRAPNNPYAARIIGTIRQRSGHVRTIPKSRAGARDIVRALKDGDHIALLMDQKYNEGIAAPFFGHPAMTSPAFGELGQKFDVPVVPMHIERLGGAHFRAIICEAIALTDDNGVPLSARDLIASGHALLEEWIRARPGEWLWIHRRWKE